MILVATFPRWPHRNALGELVAYCDEGNVIHRCPALGLADRTAALQRGNPQRNPLLPFGDTPTGLWRTAWHGPVAPASTYGVHRVLTMTPLSGDALKATQRRGIWLHGGAPGRNAATGFLRPTFGCIRVADDDMLQLWNLSRKFGNPSTIETKES